jgi:hypothetical protein
MSPVDRGGLPRRTNVALVELVKGVAQLRPVGTCAACCLRKTFTKGAAKLLHLRINALAVADFKNRLVILL